MDGILVIDESGIIQTSNPATKRMFGYSASELTGKNVKALLSEFCRGKCDDFFLNFPRTEENGINNKRHEILCSRKDGATLLLEISIQEMRMGEKRMFTCLLEDISERKRSEDALRKAKEDAENATMLKDKFVGLVAHDLRAPFASILGFLRLIQQDSANPLIPKHAETIRRSIEAGEGLVKLIDELLKQNRFRTGKMGLNQSFFDAYLITALVLGDRAGSAREKGIELRNKVPKGTRLYADPDLFKEVLFNLVSNSVKFCDVGDEISILTPSGNNAAIAVKDTGCGIREDILQKLFQIDFNVIKRGTRGEKGTGLGLSFCREIMEAHGGKIAVDSTPGQGSIFYVSLPAVKPRVLVVDDDSADRELIKEFFGDFNVEIMGAENGKRALEILRQFVPHLVVTDLFMPEMDGYGLIRHIRKDPDFSSLPIIAITSARDSRTRDYVFQTGANDFVTKHPLKMEDFNARVKRYIGYGFAV